MSAAQILAQFEKLPVEEQRKVFVHIRDKFDDDPAPEQLAEFERRGEELARHPQTGIPWEQVRTELKDRIKGRTCPAK